MIWVHCGAEAFVTSTQSLAARMAQEAKGIGVLVTAEAELMDRFTPFPKGVETEAIPADSTSKVRGFLQDWRPYSLIWNGGALRPALLRNTHRAGINATLINTQVSDILGGSARWIPGAAKTAVQAFDRILTLDGTTATRLRRGGVPADRVEAAGPILEDPLPLPHNQNELAVMVEALSTRPVWFAANISHREVEDMAAAHIVASRKSHRMLMLITPADLDSGPEVATTLRDAGLRVGLRSDGDDPLPEMQAYVADLPGELGLWYRAAPLTFMGGTMRGGKVLSPFDPIILGSGVVHSTRKSPHRARFQRLADVEACREIRSAAELGIAIAALSSPEQSARMALAGWEEITRTADKSNTLIRQAIEQAELAGTP